MLCLGLLFQQFLMNKKYQITNIALSPVIYKDKFLLIKRIKWPYKNLWSLPGGKIELGEHPQETVVREIKEETNLKVEFIAIRGVVSEIFYNKNKAEGHFVMWVCETRSTTDKATEQDEGEVKWFTKEELVKNKAKIIPSDYKMVETFFLKSRSKLALHKSHMHKNGKTYLLEYFGTA